MVDTNVVVQNIWEVRWSRKHMYLQNLQAYVLLLYMSWINNFNQVFKKWYRKEMYHFQAPRKRKQQTNRKVDQNSKTQEYQKHKRQENVVNKREHSRGKHQLCQRWLDVWARVLDDKESTVSSVPLWTWRERVRRSVGKSLGFQSASVSVLIKS